jgi:hypothetical protein
MEVKAIFVALTVIVYFALLPFACQSLFVKILRYAYLLIPIVCSKYRALIVGLFFFNFKFFYLVARLVIKI